MPLVSTLLSGGFPAGLFILTEPCVGVCGTEMMSCAPRFFCQVPSSASASAPTIELAQPLEHLETKAEAKTDSETQELRVPYQLKPTLKPQRKTSLRQRLVRKRKWISDCPIHRSFEELLNAILCLSPEARLSPSAALLHPFFSSFLAVPSEV